MGREIKRVPLDFDWPLNKVWEGFVRPDSLDGLPCPEGCDGGYSPEAKYLNDLWYGYVPFSPEDNGSTPFDMHTEAVQRRARANYPHASDPTVDLEMRRLLSFWNGAWSHHLNADDVAALMKAGRLMDFTHTIVPGKGWVKIEPPVIPTPEQVNEWSLTGFGHDSINRWAVVQARCEREGLPITCASCEGHGSIEAYPGQREDAEAWESTEPPTGEGWQLWETVSEGSPISPVFATAEEMAQWLTTPANCWGISRPMTISAARAFVGSGWAPTGVIDAGGVHEGADFIGTSAVLQELEQ